MEGKKILVAAVVLIIIALLCLAVAGCGGDASATEPALEDHEQGVALGGQSAEAETLHFTYTHEAGCPVTLLVWFWNEGEAGRPLLFTNVEDNIIAGASPADSVSWRLNVFNDQTVGFTISGWGDARYNQPGACF